MASNAQPKARVSKQQLLKNLAILESIPSVFIPPDLPPSPPPSRDPSPSLKRKHDPDDDNANKRARVTTASPLPPSPPKTESPVPSPPAVLHSEFRPTPVEPLQQLVGNEHEGITHYVCRGTILKRVSDPRFERGRSALNTLEGLNDDLKFGVIESVDSVINYAYGYWLAEVAQKNRKDPNALAGHWRTLLPSFVAVVRRCETLLRVSPADSSLTELRERVQAIQAMVRRLDGFIHAILSRESLGPASRVVGTHMRDLRSSTSPHGQTPQQQTSPPGQQPTPPTLPSPASAHTPPSAQDSNTAAVTRREMEALKQALDDARHAQTGMSVADESPFLRPESIRRLFPHTARRIDYSRRTAGPLEELAILMDPATGTVTEDKRIELAACVLEWPTAPGSSPGGSVGALCIALRSMLWELGADVGYEPR